MGNFSATWSAACERLRQTVDRESYERYLANVVPLSYDPRTQCARLGVLNELMALWLHSNYDDVIAKALEEAMGDRVKVEFEAGHATVAEERPPPTITVPEPMEPARETEESNCRPDFTFDNFIIGDNNRIAVASAEAVVKKPGTGYNPLFIYGGTSLGKTHLLQAMANELLGRRRRAKIEYVTSEEFLNRYVDALKNKTLPSFRRHFRSLDVLLIDDVQFFKSKAALGEEFFHTFNTLHNAHKQIVLASDRTPQELEGIENRLVSRFSCGISAEIGPPNFETRVAILRKKQDMQRIKLPDEVLQLLAERIQSNIRNLEGALVTLVMHVSIFGGEIGVKEAERILRDKFANERGQMLTIDLIQRTVAEHFDIRAADMTSRKRPRSIAEPRMVAMYLARELTDKSLPAIGEAFNRNHATVVHAIGRVNERMNQDEEFHGSVDILKRKLKR